MFIPAEMLEDRYWGSLLHIFMNNGKLHRYLNPEYVDISNRSVKGSSLKAIARPWSQAEKFMLNLALHLFNERHKVHLSDMDYLDENNKRIALDAIKIRYRLS